LRLFAAAKHGTAPEILPTPDTPASHIRIKCLRLADEKGAVTLRHNRIAHSAERRKSLRAISFTKRASNSKLGLSSGSLEIEGSICRFGSLTRSVRVGTFQKTAMFVVSCILLVYASVDLF